MINDLASLIIMIAVGIVLKVDRPNGNWCHIGCPIFRFKTFVCRRRRQCRFCRYIGQYLAIWYDSIWYAYMKLFTFSSSSIFFVTPFFILVCDKINFIFNWFYFCIIVIIMFAMLLVCNLFSSILFFHGTQCEWLPCFSPFRNIYANYINHTYLLQIYLIIIVYIINWLLNLFYLWTMFPT